MLELQLENEQCLHKYLIFPCQHMHLGMLGAGRGFWANEVVVGFCKAFLIDDFSGAEFKGFWWNTPNLAKLSLSAAIFASSFIRSNLALASETTVGSGPAS